MSLINEALKKAQRARHEVTVAGASASDANGPIIKRAEARSAKSMLLLVVGAVVLVVASMVATALWLTRPAGSQAPVTPKPPPSTAVAAQDPAPPVLIVPASPQAPVAAPLASTTSARPVTPSTAPTESRPTPAFSEPTVPKPSVAVTDQGAVQVRPSKAEPTPASPPPEPPAPKPDERVQQFVDAVRVTGIRSSGSESKVLMNDRVYRVNDIVDRALGIRLTKVAADSLTFTDTNGVTYAKNF